MVITDLMDVAAALDAGLVPAEMVNPEFMDLLASSEKVVFGEDADGLVHRLIAASLTGTQTSLGKDIPAANSTKLKAIRDQLSAWVRMARVEAAAVPVAQTQDAVVFRALDQVVRDAALRGVRMRKDCGITTGCVLLAPKQMATRDPFSKATHEKTALVNWVASTQKQHLGEFLESLIAALYHKPAATNLDHLMKAIFGAQYAGTPATLRTVKGASSGCHGAYLFVPLYGTADKAAVDATHMLEKVLATIAKMDGVRPEDQEVMGFKQVLSVGKPAAVGKGEHLYSMDMGDELIPDAQAYKSVVAAFKAAENASVDGDTWKQAKVVKMALELSTASGQMSRLHMVTRGEIGLKARTGLAFNGKAFPLYEVMLEATEMIVYCYMHNLGTDQPTKDNLRNLICKKAGVSAATTTAGDHKVRNKTVVESGVLLFTDSSLEEGLRGRTLQEVEGVHARMGGVVPLTSSEASYLRMVVEEPKVVVAFSPTGLTHLLDKLAMPYTLLRAPGGGGGGGGAEVAALRQQLSRVELQASEQHAEAAANFASLAAAREAEAAEARANAERLSAAVNASQTQVQGLEDSLRRVYGELKCAQESAALANQLNAEKQHAQGEAMMQRLQEFQRQSAQVNALVHAVLKAAPDLALAVREQATISLGGQAGGGAGSGAGDGGEQVDIEMLVEQLSPARPAEEIARGADEVVDAEVMAALTEEELAAANERLQAARRGNAGLDAGSKPVPLGGGAKGECTVVGQHAEGCTWGSDMEWDKQRGSYSPDLELHRWQLSYATAAAAHEAEVRGGHDQFTPGMVWAVVVVFTYFRRMCRLLGRCYASVHKARRKRRGAAGKTAERTAVDTAGERGGEERGVGRGAWVAIATVILSLGMATVITAGRLSVVEWAVGRGRRYGDQGFGWDSIHGAQGVERSCGLSGNNGTFFHPHGDVFGSCNRRDLFLQQRLQRDELCAATDRILQQRCSCNSCGPATVGKRIAACGSLVDEADDGSEVRTGRHGWWTGRRGVRWAEGDAWVSVAGTTARSAPGIRSWTNGLWSENGWGAVPHVRWRGAWAVGSLDVQHGQTISGSLDASTGTQGERWRCRGCSKERPARRRKTAECARGTPVRLARRLRWTDCTGVADPDDHCCVPTLQRTVVRSGPGQDKWRGAAGETRRSTMPGYMILVMGTLIVGSCSQFWWRLVEMQARSKRGTEDEHAPAHGAGGATWQRAGRARTRRALAYGHGAHNNWWPAVVVVLCLMLESVEASEEDAAERSMLFNTRGLAVSTAAAAAGAGFFFAQAALSKLAFIAQVLKEKSIDFGVLVELICDHKQAKLLVQWFKGRGYGLVVATGERCLEKRTTRNSVAVFYRLAGFKPVKGPDVGKYRACSTDKSPDAATKLGQRILRMALRRRDMSVVNVVAWHGCHGEPEFARQMDAIEGIAGAGSDAVIMGDVNRRAATSQSNRASALNNGDRRWKAFVGWRDDGIPDPADHLGRARLVPMLDESEAAATRRAVVDGVEQWAVLDRMVETGAERVRWELDEIVWAEYAGADGHMLSDHAAVCFVRPRCTPQGGGGEPRPTLPKMKNWRAAQHRRFAELTKNLAERVRAECGDDPAEQMRSMDAELAGAAEMVELERIERAEGTTRSDLDNFSLKEKWEWRLRKLLCIRDAQHRVRLMDWATHPKCELRHDWWHHVKRRSDDESMWRGLVRRCRKEVRFFTRVCDIDRAQARRLAERVARTEAEEDPLRRVKLAHDLLRGKWEAQEKVAAVAFDDDPEQGFVHDPEGVRREAANIGRLAQEEYRYGEVAPDNAFEAWLEHFAVAFEELKAPDGVSGFDLDELLTFELFDETLMAYARYKSVGAKVKGAVSALELVRRLDKEGRRAYFNAAKRCILSGKGPEHWEQMVYVLLPKKHGDQRRIRKKREIALMDQTLKLMLKCVKKVSYDRMVGRTGEENHGWVPGHGALNAALMMDAILGQARELHHAIYVLFLDLKQFFPAIKRKARTAAEYFIGLPDEVVRLAKAVFLNMRAKFDTAHGMSDGFDILGGDLMGCVLSPSHARCLLTSISIAIAAVSSGVRVWGCDKKARHVAQTMMADDWAGFSTTEESLQAQWAVWVDYAMATGSPIGVAGLEKTVVTAARFHKGKWVDIPVKLRIPSGAGGFKDMPELVPQMSCREAYPHMGIPRSICGGRGHMQAKLRKGVAALVHKLRRVRFDQGQHVTCANCLKGSYVGYYAAAYGLTMAEAEGLEKIWRAAFRAVFGVHPSTPVAHFYGGQVDRVADSLHGRHVMVDAVCSLYNTCRRALASPEDSSERATARSALARRLRKWGCSRAPSRWLGSREHRNTAKVMEEELEAGRVQGEAFDFFILYTAWMTEQDIAIQRERAERRETVWPLRSVLEIEHEEQEWGEALMHGDHTAWLNGTSKSLHDALGHAAPGVFILAGITLTEHVCKPSSNEYAFEMLTFNELARRWGLPSTPRVFKEYNRMLGELRDGYQDTAPWFGEERMARTMVKPCTAWQLWDGCGRIGSDGVWRGGWPVGDGVQSRRKGSSFTEMLQKARASGETIEKSKWAEALRETYKDVRRKDAVEWRDGAPSDVDRYGTRIVQVWPGADHRSGGDVRIAGRRAPCEQVAQGRGERELAAIGWEVGEDGGLERNGCRAGPAEAEGLPCVQLLIRTTEMMRDEGAEIDRSEEVTIRGAGSWAVHVETSKRLLSDWNELHAEFDVQFAAATDGGRQSDEGGNAKASAAAIRNDGRLVGRALEANTWARSSYECEMQALIDLLRDWPAGSRVLVAIDARSPVQAVVRFREVHVNRRAEYFCDDMLDELLREIERMDTVIFYWLKGHSGAAPNEAADFQATMLLEEEPGDIGQRPARRHASLTFAFDRRPFAWAAERAARHVQAVLRGKSQRSMWRKPSCWALKWGRGEADRKRVLHAAQTRRLLFGDAAYFEGERGERARTVRCNCGGGPCDTAHWLFECKLVRAEEQRSLLVEKTEEVATCLKELSGGRPSAAVEGVIKALKGTSKSDAARAAALEWLVGCARKPRDESKGARDLAMAALRQSADSLRMAVKEYKQLKADFMAGEKERTRARGFITKLRAWVAVRGPSASKKVESAHNGNVAAAVGEAKRAIRALGPRRTWRQEAAVLAGAAPRGVSRSKDWLTSYAEWGAALAILKAWRRKYARFDGNGWEYRVASSDGNTRRIAVGLSSTLRWWLVAASRCPDRGLLERKAARAKAKLAKEKKERVRKMQAGLLQAMLGAEGEGNITLAEGLEDVDVQFSRKRRANWRRPGHNKRRRTDKARRSEGSGARKGSGRNGRGGSGWQSDSETDGQSEDDAEGGEEWGFTDGGCSSDDESDGDDGERCDGKRRVRVGDLLRIYWTEDEVWFRCRVTGVRREDKTVRVEYLLPGWEPFVHDLDTVQWERWATGDEVDAREAEYHPEVWMGPEDQEARAAAEAASQRTASQADREVRRSAAEARKCTAGACNVGGTSTRQRSDDKAVTAEAETDGAADADMGRFDGLVAAVAKGKGAKKRKALAERLARAWHKAEREGRQPSVAVTTVYRLMSGVMAAKAIKAELKELCGAGLAVLRDDEVSCGRWEGLEDDGDGGARRGARGADGGARRAAKRRRGRVAVIDSSDEEQGVSSEEEMGQRSTRKLRRTSVRCRRDGGGGATYAESDQESGEESEGV